MKKFVSRPAVAIAAAAVLSMSASPVFARSWHHRDRGLDAGDVIAGVLIIGGIAAVASAASKSNRDGRYRNRDYRPGDYRSGDYPNRDYRNRDYRSQDRRYGEDDYDYDRAGYRGAGNIDAAIQTCVDEVERGNRRIETVDAANRDGSEWRIEGRMTGGSDFECLIGDDLRVRNATVDGRAVF